MKLLAGKLYDPAVAVSKATTALLAMTALDTTNLRLAFTIPAHGMVRVHVAGVLHGSTTVPQIMLGVLEGSTVRGRQRPMLGGGNVAATTGLLAEAWFTVTGLTPGAVNWDAAYGVETVVAATGLKYGGPNNTTANDAFGGFVFEIWDPAPAGGSGASAQEVWEYATRVLTAGTNIALAKGVGVTGFNDLDAAGVRTATGLASANLDTQLGVIAGYIDTEVGAILGHVDTEVAAIKAKTDNLPVDPASDTTVNTRLATAGYTAPDNASVTAIKAKTDSLTFTVAGKVDANPTHLNGTALTGNGSTTPWGPV